ncbi:hypothetical protein LY632_12595 [Erythrobacter sp. SDW2]|uniref:hypothetical protein n=1 Tax=Erythrobacter sp. SDW2 TaxID=2907154 RepID=UPI001F3722BC|nr:hypothetical protein [Erythrobacter sp. SDW2]UIP06513.1 hypothetical protein LY632_12595 [Erythrobacter sp. SDW2]
MTMVEKAPKPLWSGWVKVAGLALAGGIFGFFMARTIGQEFKDGGALSAVANSEISLLVAAMYVVMGLFVFVGSLSPKVGAAILNVEDADEVREQSTVFLPSAIGCVLMGIALGALALGGENGLLSAGTAGVMALLSLVLATIVSLAATRRSDELMRAVYKEAGSTSFYLLSAVVGGWAAAAQLALVRMPTALEVVTLVFAVPLAASFWVIGKRGMLLPR